MLPYIYGIWYGPNVVQFSNVQYINYVSSYLYWLWYLEQLVCDRVDLGRQVRSCHNHLGETEELHEVTKIQTVSMELIVDILQFEVNVLKDELDVHYEGKRIHKL